MAFKIAWNKLYGMDLNPIERNSLPGLKFILMVWNPGLILVNLLE